MKYKHLSIVLLIIMLIGIVVWYSIEYGIGSHKDKEFHIHTDIRIVINGEVVDFARIRYQSLEKAHRHPTIHLHDYDGDVIHWHEADTNLADFFSAVGLQLTDYCISYDDVLYCEQNDNTLRIFVNDKELDRNDTSYEPKDLDRILILYGNYSSKRARQEQRAVTSRACIQSNTCPARGVPTDEAGCSTGGSGGCSIIVPWKG